MSETGADIVAFMPPTPEAREDGLVVDLDGYEGPLDVLLALARAQKVDITRISILALAEQFLDFVQQARRLQLELAADYLVMAAWLAYLKSRLLLPREEDEEEPSGEELAARLAFRLQRLDAMRTAAARLMARNRLGIHVFQRGAPQGVRVIRKSVYEAELYDLLKAYADQRVRAAPASWTPKRLPTVAIEDARKRLEGLLGTMVDWSRLDAFMPPELMGPELRRSAIASAFSASLELVRDGYAEIRQEETFAPVYLRKRRSEAPATRPTPFEE